MKERFRKATKGALALETFLTAALLRPIWHLKVVFLALMSLGLAGLVAMLAVPSNRFSLMGGPG